MIFISTYYRALITIFDIFMEAPEQEEVSGQYGCARPSSQDNPVPPHTEITIAMESIELVILAM